MFNDSAAEEAIVDSVKEFVASGGPEQATRVFDFAMTIADLNNLVDTRKT